MSRDHSVLLIDVYPYKTRGHIIKRLKYNTTFLVYNFDDSLVLVSGYFIDGTELILKSNKKILENIIGIHMKTCSYQ